MKKNQIPYYLLVLFLSFFSFNSFAQTGEDELLNGLLQDQKQQKQYVEAAFKASRLINMNTTELVAPKSMEFRISHRFGPVNKGAYELWGLDQATLRLGFDFGIKPWLMVGFGRSTYEKTYDGVVKMRLFRQSMGEKAFPFTLLYFSDIAINTLSWADPSRKNLLSSRFSYTHQLIFGRKFNRKLSLVLVPTLVHYNLVTTAIEPNDRLALGTGGRYKLTKRMALTAEYFLRWKDRRIEDFNKNYNSLSVGLDIETGGHVFQLHCSNSLPMIEKGFVAETNESWLKGGIHFGFNITREFSFKKSKKPANNKW